MKCPACGALLEGSTYVGEGDERPTPGAVTVCLYCARLAFYTDELELRRPTDRELVELMADPKVRRAVSVVKTLGPRTPGGRVNGNAAEPH